jgi:hypothetical protein
MAPISRWCEQQTRPGRGDRAENRAGPTRAPTSPTAGPTSRPIASPQYRMLARQRDALVRATKRRAGRSFGPPPLLPASSFARTRARARTRTRSCPCTTEHVCSPAAPAHTHSQVVRHRGPGTAWSPHLASLTQSHPGAVGDGTDPAVATMAHSSATPTPPATRRTCDAARQRSTRSASTHSGPSVRVHSRREPARSRRRRDAQCARGRHQRPRSHTHQGCAGLSRHSKLRARFIRQWHAACQPPPCRQALRCGAAMRSNPACGIIEVAVETVSGGTHDAALRKLHGSHGWCGACSARLSPGVTLGAV